MQALSKQPVREVIMPNAILQPGRPCAKCGAGDFNSYGRCKACARAAGAIYRANYPDRVRASKESWEAANSDKDNARKAVYRAENPEKVKAATAAWRAANPDKLKAYAEAYRAANPDKSKVSAAAWHIANPEARRIYQQNREARKRKIGGTLSKGLSVKLFKLQKGMCACCKKPLGDDYQLDHIMPLALSGPNSDENMQLLRKTCNHKKHAKHPVDFMQERGFLI